MYWKLRHKLMVISKDAGTDESHAATAGCHHQNSEDPEVERSPCNDVVLCYMDLLRPPCSNANKE